MLNKLYIHYYTLKLALLHPWDLGQSCLNKIGAAHHWPSSVWNGRKSINLLKGQCHEIFSWITFPQAPENNIRIISIFFWKFAEIFASQGAPPVSTSPAANLPPVPLVLLTPVQICHRCQPYRRQICRRCQWRRWQLATDINDTGGAPWTANVSANFRKKFETV